MAAHADWFGEDQRSLRGIPEADNERLQKVEAWRIAQTRLRGLRDRRSKSPSRTVRELPVKVSLPRRNEAAIR